MVTKVIYGIALNEDKARSNGIRNPNDCIEGLDNVGTKYK